MTSSGDRHPNFGVERFDSPSPEAYGQLWAELERLTPLTRHEDWREADVSFGDGLLSVSCAQVIVRDPGMTEEDEQVGSRLSILARFPEGQAIIGYGHPAPPDKQVDQIRDLVLGRHFQSMDPRTVEWLKAAYDATAERHESDRNIAVDELLSSAPNTTNWTYYGVSEWPIIEQTTDSILPRRLKNATEIIGDWMAIDDASDISLQITVPDKAGETCYIYRRGIEGETLYIRRPGDDLGELPDPRIPHRTLILPGGLAGEVYSPPEKVRRLRAMDKAHAKGADRLTEDSLREFNRVLRAAIDSEVAT